MYGLIGTEDSRRLLREFIQDAVTQKIGHFEPDTFVKLCQQISNLAIEILFLDFRCTSDDAIIKGARMIRFHRSNTRIVVIAPNREPGDPCISALVSLGVYDIIAYPEDTADETEVADEIRRLLHSPPNYANAARWHFQLDEPNIQEKTEKKRLIQPPTPPRLEEFLLDPPPIRPKVVERLVGTATIAVTGVTRRTGSTHLAISLSTYLSRRNYEVACVELSEYPVFQFFQEEEPARIEAGFHREADFYPRADERLMHSIFSRRYQFIVLDLGQVISESRTHAVQSELGRASVMFLTMGPSEWDFNFLIQTLDTFHNLGLGHSWNVVVNFADPDTFREIEQAFTPAEREKLRVRFFRNPIQANPFQVHADQERLFENCLATLIPKKDKRRFRLF